MTQGICCGNNTDAWLQGDGFRMTNSFENARGHSLCIAAQDPPLLRPRNVAIFFGIFWMIVRFAVHQTQRLVSSPRLSPGLFFRSGKNSL